MLDFKPTYLPRKDLYKLIDCVNAAAADKLYRCEARSYSYVIDAEMELYGSTSPVLEIYTHEVLKRTPCGAWIRWGGAGKGRKFVRLTAAKQYASEDISTAISNYVFRKKRHIKILKGQLRDAEYGMDLATHALEEMAGSKTNMAAKQEEKRSG